MLLVIIFENGEYCQLSDCDRAPDIRYLWSCSLPSLRSTALRITGGTYFNRQIIEDAPGKRSRTFIGVLLALRNFYFAAWVSGYFPHNGTWNTCMASLYFVDAYVGCKFSQPCLSSPKDHSSICREQSSTPEVLKEKFHRHFVL